MKFVSCENLNPLQPSLQSSLSFEISISCYRINLTREFLTFLLDFTYKSFQLSSDEHLSKFWKLDLLWSHMNQYKVHHKLMPCFKINLSVKKSQGNINEATIPIFFEKTLMYINPDFRGKKSLKTNLQMNEFKRLIGTDNFISMCSSTGQLFTFLDFFHQQVVRTITVVDNFFSIVSKNSAIVEKNEEL